MNKIIITYTVSGLALFGALFSALALSGALVPGQTVGEVAQEKKIAAAEAVTLYKPPTLEPERVYKISHQTPIYTSPSETDGERQMLPAGGFFTMTRVMEEVSDGPWFEISVDDGLKSWTMYLKANDLRWKTLTPQYRPDEHDRMVFEATQKKLQELGLFRRRGPPPPVREPDPKPETAKDWWAEAGQRVGGRTYANLIGSGAIAGIATLTILGSMVLLTMLRREHAWSTPAMHSDHEYEDDDAIDMEPSEDAYTYVPPTGDDEDYAQGGNRYRG